MATLQSLELALRQVATAAASKKQPLSDAQYSAGLSFFTTGSGWATYQKFIIPQLSKVLAPHFRSRSRVSVLEIGPGPKSVLAYLPRQLRQKIKRYVAYEPNRLFATNLQEWLSFSAEGGPPLPCLESLSDIRRVPFVLDSDANMNATTNDGDEKFDIVLFCHSMYGMKPERNFIERALGMLVEQPGDGMVVVFHQACVLNFDGLVCHRTASFPTGDILVADEDKALDSFAPFIADFIMKDVGQDVAVRKKWREVCRALGRRKEGHPYHLQFSAPEIMVAFTRHATALPDLAADVPLMKGEKAVKNREVRLHRPAAIARPREIRHVQQCVQWTLKHGASLTIVSGGHSGHCLWPNVVAVDMEAFDQVHILTAGDSGSSSGSLVVAEAGCKTGDIIRKAMEVGLTVPLGSRPSVGAGLWLQGGIGHLARQYGLASDAIIGAVVVSLDFRKVFCIGQVPSEHCPADAVHPDNESDLLWAIKGAGTNFGIVVSVTFNAFTASTFMVRSWNVPLSDGDDLDPQQRLKQFNVVAKKLPGIWSADAYLYWEADELHLGVTMYESQSANLDVKTHTCMLLDEVLGPQDSFKVVDGVGLFNTEMYMSGMHGGHGGGKTSLFKRCLFIKDIGAADIANISIEALENLYGAADVDVLLITGMRDKAPVAAFSQLVPDSRLLEVRIEVSKETKRARRGSYCDEDGDFTGQHQDIEGLAKELGDCPSLIFDNNAAGDNAAESFAKQHLFALLHKDMQRLADIVRPIPNFPRQGIKFQHVLNVSQQPGGLALYSSLLQTHFSGDWAKVSAIAYCEAGDFVFASALSIRVDVPLLLIREAGKLPPPTISVNKSSSHISSHCSGEKKIAMDRDMVSRGASVVVMDDVLAKGETLCAVLQLIVKTGIDLENISVMVVAEFPTHGGRRLLHQRGFGRVMIQSLLVFGGL
ncbi:hypothetical protein MKX08_003014 [Trichoderma sp. CBMAI-0020]|nr:hypothetical protein MKX08_003014 [Trichoderma sp. CBMAI-0020]